MRAEDTSKTNFSLPQNHNVCIGHMLHVLILLLYMYMYIYVFGSDITMVVRVEDIPKPILVHLSPTLVPLQSHTVCIGHNMSHVLIFLYS